MPGYLTHAKVVLDTVDWLSAVEDRLQKQIDDKKKLSPLEKTILDRAKAARQLLQYKTGSVEVTAPEYAAKIDPPEVLKKSGKLTGVGHGVSRYAFTGSLGVDFPGAAYLFALNQHWVGRTMHWGSPKTPWLKAGSTRFIFNTLDQIRALPGAPGPKPMPSPTPAPGVAPLTAGVLGHCAAVSAHVVLHPFIQALAADTGAHFDLENALDAQLAVGFFQRDDMHSGDSWTDYYLEDNEWKVYLEVYLEAFNKTYGGPFPASPMCALPAIPALKEKFSELDKLLQQFPNVEPSLARYQGYGKLFKPLPKGESALAEQEFGKASALKDFLTEYRCRTPDLDDKLLDDGMRNTVKWAIDAGYDHGPAGYRWLWFLAFAAEGFYIAQKTISSLSSFSTTLEFITCGEFKHPDSQAIADQSLEDWKNDGLANPDLILTCVENSYDPGVFTGAFTYFNFLMAGMGPLGDGLFGQGRESFGEATTGEKVWKIGGYVYLGGVFLLEEIAPKVTQSFPVGLAKFGLGFLKDVLDTWVFNARDEAKGKEGDVFAQSMWLLQVMRWPFYFVSLLLVLGVKSTQKEADETREKSYTFRDFVLSQIFPILAASILVFWQKQFETQFFKGLGVRWPSIDTAPIAPYLTVEVKDKLNILKDGKKSGVRLFPGAALTKPANARSFVEASDAAATAYPADRAGAKTAGEFTLLQLFDRSKYLSGLLAMTAVNYLSDTAPNRTKTREIFDDWNLDFRTEDEWLALMEADPKRPGLLEATDVWWKNLQAGKTSEAPVLNRLQALFGLAKTTGAGKGMKVSLQYEDGTPMRDAEFEAVFGETRVPGRTDEEGVALIDAPAHHGDSYQLFLVSYPQERVVAEA